MDSRDRACPVSTPPLSVHSGNPVLTNVVYRNTTPKKNRFKPESSISEFRIIKKKRLLSATEAEVAVIVSGGEVVAESGARVVAVVEPRATPKHFVIIT